MSTRLFEVRRDKNAGDWKVVSGRGAVVSRAGTRREAESQGRSFARQTSDSGFSVTLRIRNIDGSVSEEYSYGR
jgi:Uncharacterized protein conserved in bacteria (DUF2188)